MALQIIPVALKIGAALLSGGLLGMAVKSVIKKKPDLFEDKKKINVAVLGLAGTGKTTFQNCLRNGREVVGQTNLNGNRLDQVKIKFNGKSLILAEGFDPSGTVEGLRLHLEEEIKRSEIIFFLIKGSSFLEREDYRKENRALLNNIVKKLTDNPAKKIWIYITHKDQIEGSEIDTKKKIMEFLLKSQKQEMQRRIDNVELIDLTSQDCKSILMNRLFKSVQNE